jgi:hypothetical protein
MKPSGPTSGRSDSDASTTRRIHFRLTQDEDGYPPASGETLWATALGDGAYRVDNIPFFATGVSLGDVVEAEMIEGLPTFARVRHRGGHATLRVAVVEVSTVPELRSSVEALGCTSELSHLPRLVSIDVPPSASLETLRKYLAAGSGQGRWDYEEADVPA